MGHIPETNAAESKLAVYGMRTPTAPAAGVTPDLELRRLLLLIDQCFLSHGSSCFLSEGETKGIEQGPAFSIVLGGRYKCDVHTPD